MNSSLLSEKLVANTQKRNFAQVESELKNADIDGSIVRQIYHPESRVLMSKVLDEMHSGRWGVETFLGDPAVCESRCTKVLLDICKQSQNAFYVFPEFAATSAGPVCSLPALEVLAGSVMGWYKVAMSMDLHFLFCSTVDWRMGVVLDVYEADPLMHKTSGPVTDFYSWGC